MTAPYPRPVRPSPVDELLDAIERELNLLRYDKSLRAQHPHAFEALTRHHLAARTVVEAASREAAVRNLGRTARVITRRPLDNDVALEALEAIARAYGLRL